MFKKIYIYVYIISLLFLTNKILPGSFFKADDTTISFASSNAVFQAFASETKSLYLYNVQKIILDL